MFTMSANTDRETTCAEHVECTYHATRANQTKKPGQSYPWSISNGSPNISALPPSDVYFPSSFGSHSVDQPLQQFEALQKRTPRNLKCDYLLFSCYFLTKNISPSRPDLSSVLHVTSRGKTKNWEDESSASSEWLRDGEPGAECWLWKHSDGPRSGDDHAQCPGGAVGDRWEPAGVWLGVHDAFAANCAELDFGEPCCGWPVCRRPRRAAVCGISGRSQSRVLLPSYSRVAVPPDRQCLLWRLRTPLVYHQFRKGDRRAQTPQLSTNYHQEATRDCSRVSLVISGHLRNPPFDDQQELHILLHCRRSGSQRRHYRHLLRADHAQSTQTAALTAHSEQKPEVTWQAGAPGHHDHSDRHNFLLSELGPYTIFAILQGG